MNRIAFAVMLWICVGMEKGLCDAFALGTTGVKPSPVFILVTLVAMFATPLAATWSAFIAGLVLDLIFEYQLKDGGPSITIIGPRALGFVVAVQLILTLRGLVFRRNPLTMGFLAFTGGSVALAVAASIIALRVLFGTPLTSFSLSSELVRALASAAYTGGVAPVLAFALLPLAGRMGLPVQHASRFGRRV